MIVLNTTSKNNKEHEMDIECGAGRHFSSFEAAKECSDGQGGCDYCFVRTSYQKIKSSETDIILNNELKEKESEHLVLQCSQCGRNTLVKIRDNWYECTGCKACGPCPESIVTFEKLFARSEIANKEQASKVKPPEKPLPNAEKSQDIRTPQTHPGARCPNTKCGMFSLVLSEDGNNYTCTNPKCPEYMVPISKVAVDSYYRQIAEDRNSLDKISTTETRSWVGNQYYDTKQKRWMDGERPKRIHRVPTWFFILLAFVIISIIVTLVLGYYHPGTKFMIFGW